MTTHPSPRLRIDRELGTGTTGRVFQGVLAEGFGPYPAGFEVAVKYLHPSLESDAPAVERFEAEAAAGRATVHPGLVHVIHSGRDERGWYLVMPFVPGRNLREALREMGPLPEPLVRSIARQISGGLSALHAAGYLHGDIKPENIRLDAEGNAVLLDLGFARRAQDAFRAGRAETIDGLRTQPMDPRFEPRGGDPRGGRPGSLPYLAPEQALGEAGTTSSDVFALGVVLFELATGLHPFAVAAHSRSDGDGPRQPHWAGHENASASGSSGAVARAALEKPDADKLLAAIATGRFRPPSRFDPQLTPFFDRSLQEILQRDPSRRPDGAEVLRRWTEQEAGAWWRDVIEFEAGARRGGSGEFDAQHLTPLVGRERELEQLRAAYNEAAGRDPASPWADAVAPPTTDERESAVPARGGVVWLTGAFGSGKSRLVNEFASLARKRTDPPLYLYGRCRELEEERPCQPVLRMLERYLRLPPLSAPGKRERELLDKLVPPRVAQSLVQALDPRDERPLSMPVPNALSTFIAALGREIALIVYLDDVNWAGEDTLEVVSQLADKLHGTRILLVLGEREHVEPRHAEALLQLRERLAARARIREIGLAPLDEEAVLLLVRRMFHHSVPRLRLSNVLWQRSRGNPGLLAEILRGLLSRGQAHAHHEDGVLALDISPDDLPLPGSLKKAISESYKRLPAGDRAWLRRLSIVGGRIETEFLSKAFPDERRAEIDAMLARLVRSGWLVPAGPRYRFTRPALREAVYRSLSREQRLRLHSAAAQAMRPPIGEHLPLEDAFQIAFHLRAAEDHLTLVRLLQPLMSRLLKSGQPQRVHALALWGLESIDELPGSVDTGRMRIELLEAAVDAADRLGFRKGQRELLDRLSDLRFDPDVDPESVGRVYLLHGRYAVSTGQYGLARGMLRNAVEMFERAGKELEFSESLRRLSLVQGHVGELDDARKLARKALEHAQTDLQQALAHLALGIVDILEDRVEPALANAEKALVFLRKEKDRNLPGAYAAAYMLRARCHRTSGSPARALGSASRAVRLARLAGERRLEAEATARLGGMLLDLDRPEEAEARLREALLLAEEIEDRRGQALARVFLGILLWENNDPEAGAMLERAAEMAVETGLNRLEALTRAIQARIVREAGDVERALSSSEQAMELLARYGAELGDRVVITGTHALVLSTLGRDGEAGEHEKKLRERLKRENTRIESPLLRMRQSRASQRLLEAVLSPAGPVYPRMRADSLADVD